MVVEVDDTSTFSSWNKKELLYIEGDVNAGFFETSLSSIHHHYYRWVKKQNFHKKIRNSNKNYITIPHTLNNIQHLHTTPTHIQKYIKFFSIHISMTVNECFVYVLSTKKRIWKFYSFI